MTFIYFEDICYNLNDLLLCFYYHSFIYQYLNSVSLLGNQFHKLYILIYIYNVYNSVKLIKYYSFVYRFNIFANLISLKNLQIKN